MKIFYNCENKCHVYDFQNENMNYFSVEQDKFIKSLIYEYTLNSLKSNSLEGNNIKISFSKTYLILKTKNKNHKIDYDTFLNSYDIKDIVCSDTNKCEKIIKKCFIDEENIETNYNSCKCWCHFPKCKKYTIKGKKICYMCLQNILNIEL